ncbi:MAG: hypothetical protein ACYCRD_06600 [Leptospirillum sp.]
MGKSALRISNQDVFDSEYGGYREPRKDRRPEQGVLETMAMMWLIPEEMGCS